MYFKVLCVVLLSFLDEIRAKDNLHIKIHVPEIVNHHHHTKFLLLEDAKKPEFKKKAPIKEYFPNASPYNSFEPFDNNGFHKSWNTLRSEKYETETVENPFSDNPGNKYLVKNSYKVKEKLPYEDIATGYQKHYSYPTSEIDHDPYNYEKLADFNNGQDDFANTYNPKSEYESPKAKQKETKKKKPKKYEYHHKYPENDFEYEKELHKKIKTKTPKVYEYHRKYPENDFEYEKNLRLVDLYIKNNLNPDKNFKESQENNFKDADFENNKDVDYTNFDSDLNSPNKKFETFEDFAFTEVSSPQDENKKSKDFTTSNYDSKKSPKKQVKTPSYAVFESPEIEAFSNSADTEKFLNHNYDYDSPKVDNYASTEKNVYSPEFDSFDPISELDRFNGEEVDDKPVASDYDRLGPSHIETYANYKTDGPSFR